MDYFKASRDLMGDTGVSKRFRMLKADTMVAVERVGRDMHFVAFTQDGADYVFPEVPAQPYLGLINRLFEVANAKPSNRLSRLCTNVQPFNPAKPAVLKSYKRRNTFPDVVGIVREVKSGKERECIIVGTPKEGAKGMIVLMLDQSVIFVEDH